MFHAGDVVRIKGQHPAEGLLVVVRVFEQQPGAGHGDVATLRHFGASLEFSEYTRNLYRITCPH